MSERDVQTERQTQTERQMQAEGQVPTVRGETDSGSGDVALLPDDRLNDFRVQWERVQIGFVDRPRESVKSAHDLVDRLAEELVDSFSRQRETLESGWTQGADDTEELRQSFRRYRSFFNRLLEA